MATNFESIYEKFLMQIDDYELGIVQDYELNNVCFSYLEKARALHFPQCTKNLDNITINHVTYINGVKIEDETEMNEIVEDVVKDGLEVPLEVTEEPTEDFSILSDELFTEDETPVTEPLEDDYVFVAIEGYFNEDLTNAEQHILALGMKKAWLSSKKYSADLMSKDIGDRDYKAVQGFNYIKELKGLDSELEEEIRKYGVQYTYSLDELSTGW